jgi:chromosome segregation and condensation protein ScpB
MQGENYLIYIGIAIISFIIYVWITRVIHKVKYRNDLLKAQLQLLARIAERQGVPQEEIDEIVNQVEDKSTF